MVGKSARRAHLSRRMAFRGAGQLRGGAFYGPGQRQPRKFHDLLRLYKRDLLAKTGAGATVESGGPIWLGQRLSSSIDPNGYTNIVYKKACWVLNMLHAVITDPKTGSDARFFAMLRDFVAQYQGKSVSTEDLFVTPKSTCRSKTISNPTAGSIGSLTSGSTTRGFRNTR